LYKLVCSMGCILSYAYLSEIAYLLLPPRVSLVLLRLCKLNL
jgi:hypothetical protein